MSTSTTQPTASNFRVIYYTDREYARVLGDPLRTVIEAPTELDAEEAAPRPGLSEPRAHSNRRDQVQRTEWLPKHRHSLHQELGYKPSLRIRI